MSFTPSLPRPFSLNWRDAYKCDDKDYPRFSSYQAPGKGPTLFIQESFKLSSGQSVDTSEFPSFGYWANQPINEIPQSITVTGFLRGLDYINDRNALWQALQIETSDDECGYLEIPTWGRFPVVVKTYDVEEATKAKGQCSISITFVRAGLSGDSRLYESSNQLIQENVEDTTAEFKEKAIKQFESELIVYNDRYSPNLRVKKTNNDSTLARGAGNNEPAAGLTRSAPAGFTKSAGNNEPAGSTGSADDDETTGFIGSAGNNEPVTYRSARAIDNQMLLSGLADIKNKLTKIVGRMQGHQSQLNDMTNTAAQIIILLDQGIRNPEQLSRSLFEAVEAMIVLVKSIQNSVDDSVKFFTVKDNIRNMLLLFLVSDKFELKEKAITEAQRITKKEVENLYKMISYFASALLLAELETTYQKHKNFWDLFIRLENSINQSNPEIYAAIEKIRISVSKTLIEKESDVELSMPVDLPIPVLVLASYLGCPEEKIRDLNNVADSFICKGNMIYV